MQQLLQNRQEIQVLIKKLGDGEDSDVAGDDKDGENYDPDQRQLEEDSFSFLVFSSSWASTLSAIFVFLLQLCLFFVIFTHNYEHDPPRANEGAAIDTVKESFRLPHEIEDQEVRLAGFFALIIALPTQQDVMISLTLWRDGYSDKMFASFKGTSYLKWAASSICRFLEGSLGLAVSLLLIVRSTDVLDLLLNFSAIEVVTTLDDAAFSLAKRGYFGENASHDAWKVSKTVYVVPKASTRWYLSNLMHFILFAILCTFWYAATLPGQELPDLDCIRGHRTALRFNLTNDFPGETAWDLVDWNGKLLANGGPYDDSQDEISEHLCLSEEICANFTVYGHRIGPHGLSFGEENLLWGSGQEQFYGSGYSGLY